MEKDGEGLLILPLNELIYFYFQIDRFIRDGLNWIELIWID
jgi:hypothetical protein